MVIGAHGTFQKTYERGYYLVTFQKIKKHNLSKTRYIVDSYSILKTTDQYSLVKF